MFYSEVGSVQTLAEENHCRVPSFRVPYRGSRQIRYAKEISVTHVLRYLVEPKSQNLDHIFRLGPGYCQQEQMNGRNRHHDHLSNNYRGPHQTFCEVALPSTALDNFWSAEMSWRQDWRNQVQIWTSWPWGIWVLYAGKCGMAKALMGPSWRKKRGGRQISLQRLFKPGIYYHS